MYFEKFPVRLCSPFHSPVPNRQSLWLIHGKFWVATQGELTEAEKKAAVDAV